MVAPVVAAEAPVAAEVAAPEAPVVAAAPEDVVAPNAEAPVAAVEGQVAEPEPPAHRYHDRLTKAFPDRQYADDTEYETAIEEHLDSLESYHSRGQESNQALMDIFDSSPEVANIMKDMKAGATFREALVRHIDPSDLVASEGDPDHEAWAANNTERQTKFASDEEFRANFSTNMDASAKTISDFATENNLTPEQGESLFSNLENVLEQVSAGQVTKETLGWLMKGINFEAKVAEAAEEGELKGANGKILEKRTAVEAANGDNLPHPTASNEAPKEEGKEENYFEKLANHENSKKVL